MDFITYCLYGVSTICLLFTFNPFIEFVFGSKFVLPFIVVLLIMINYYLVGLNQVPIIVQSAAGVYKYDKYVPMIEAFVNLTLSVILAQFLGISGVLIGTLVSYLFPLIIKPFVVFKYVLFKKISIYFKNFIKQLAILVLSGILVFMFVYFVHLPLLGQIIFNFVISLVIPTLIIILAYRKSLEFQNAKGRLVYLFNKFRKRA